MKNKVLLLFGILALVALQANAELTVEDVRSREYLKNHGHSDATADIVEMSNAAVNGEKAVLPIHHKYENKPAIYRWVDKFFIYVDPVLDDGKFLRHDISTEPAVDDL